VLAVQKFVKSHLVLDAEGLADAALGVQCSACVFKLCSLVYSIGPRRFGKLEGRFCVELGRSPGWLTLAWRLAFSALWESFFKGVANKAGVRDAARCSGRWPADPRSPQSIRHACRTSRDWLHPYAFVYT